jgi:hypothetical protein
MDIGIVLGAFVGWPWLALLPAAAFALLWVRRRRAPVLVAALAWLAYFPYEQAMKLRILCSGECNIRIDLLLFYPLLGFLSIAALVVALRRGQQ